MPSRRDEHLEQMYIKHRHRLVRWLNRILMYRDGAEDIAQDAYMKLREQYGDARGASAASLLWTIANRIAIDRLRRQLRQVSLPNDFEQQPAPEEREPTAQAIEAERQRLVREAIARQRPNHCQILTMRCLHDMSHSEIAHALGISVSAVEQRLTGARREFERDPLLRKLAAKAAD